MLKVSCYPKIDHVFDFCHFQIDIIQTSLLQKVSEKKIVSTQSYGRKKICGIDFLQSCVDSHLSTTLKIACDITGSRCFDTRSIA